MPDYKRLDQSGLQYYSSKIKEKIDAKLAIISLTEAEYNELSETEKNRADVIYEIKDKDGESSGGGS